MRMKHVPRALQSENSIAEQIELGSGMSDRRVDHFQENKKLENDWFKNMAESNPDPRFARSDYHDPVNNIVLDKREQKDVEEVELAEGYIEDVIMYPDGAHIKILNEDEIYFVFIKDLNFIVKGTKIKVVDTVVTVTHLYGSYAGESGEFSKEETHSLDILVVSDDDDIESENNEIKSEE